KETRELRDLPAGWSAAFCIFPESRSLLAVTHIAAASQMFFTFVLYFDSTSENEARAALTLLTDSLTIHFQPVIPWECYDLNFTLSSAFRLAETAFLSGRKQMTFHWRQRRLYVWLFSLADLALAGRPLPAFAAEFLKTVKGLRGPRFVVEEDGSVSA